MKEYTVRNDVNQYINKSIELVFSSKKAYFTFDKELAQDLADRANEKFNHVSKFRVFETE